MWSHDLIYVEFCKALDAFPHIILSELGPVLFNIFTNDLVGLSVPSVNLQMTPICVVQLTCLRERLPFRETWPDLISLPV